MTATAEELLQRTPTRSLLRTYAALTHRIHETTSSTRERDLREQRDMVEAEVLRRTGDQP